MPECVVLNASTKILAGKRCDFSYPRYDFLSHPTTHHSPTVKASPRNKN